ncbi:hypothetical protein ACFVZM_06715 [Streptomyces sioyaensis]|uniref:hypothetical protein n=1 Tax=Streptomyces sioyaensis TaxID=67364 RepID=UPI003698117A
MSDVTRRRSAPAPVALPELRYEDIKSEGETQLVARGSAYAREYVTKQQEAKTLVKNLAMVLWALRMEHDDPLGRSGPYRQAAAELYASANLDAEAEERLQTAVRWHIGNIRTRYMTPRELEAAGLKLTSPLERQRDTREANAALLTGLRAAAALESAQTATVKVPKKKGKAPAEPVEPPLPPTTVVANHLRLSNAALSIVRQMDPDVVSEGLTDGQRAKLDDDLAALQKEVAALRRKARKRTSA